MTEGGPERNERIAPVLVAGVGNLLLSDEGVGCRVAERLSADPDLPRGVEARDFGTAGMRLFHALAGRDRAVIVDCADFGGAPGEIRRFTPDDVKTRKCLPRLSLHEGDLLQLLELARTVGEAPGEVVLIGIQPEHLSPGPLSDTLERRLPDYLDAVRRAWGPAPSGLA